MRINSFLKGGLAGGIGATAVLGATAAFAGSGIGGVLVLVAQHVPFGATGSQTSLSRASRDAR